MATACLAGLTFPTTFALADAAMLHQLDLVNGAYKEFILAAAQQCGLQPSVICGLGSRESGWGLLLTPPGPAGTGDFAPRNNTKPFRSDAMPPDGKGYGRGLMQIDYDAFAFAQTGNWHDPEANIGFGCKVLHDSLMLLAHKTSLPGLMLLRAAIAAYNCGAGNVHKALQQSQDVDAFTVHGNYSADVLNRAGFISGAWLDLRYPRHGIAGWSRGLRADEGAGRAFRIIHSRCNIQSSAITIQVISGRFGSPRAGSRGRLCAALSGM